MDTQNDALENVSPVQNVALQTDHYSKISEFGLKFWGWSGCISFGKKTVEIYCNWYHYTPWKFNSLPLKICQAPKGKETSLPTISFSGVNSLLNFGGVSLRPLDEENWDPVPIQRSRTLIKDVSTSVKQRKTVFFLKDPRVSVDPNLLKKRNDHVSTQSPHVIEHWGPFFSLTVGVIEHVGSQGPLYSTNKEVSASPRFFSKTAPNSATWEHPTSIRTWKGSMAIATPMAP